MAVSRVYQGLHLENGLDQPSQFTGARVEIHLKELVKFREKVSKNFEGYIVYSTDLILLS